MSGSSSSVRVTRFGSLTALGSTRGAFARLCAGEDGFGGGPRPEWAEGGLPLALVDRDVSAFSRHRTTGLLLALLHDELGDVDPNGLAVVAATTTSGMREGEEAVFEWLAGAPVREPADFLWNGLAHQTGIAVSAALGATGPSLTVSTACTSGTAAIGVAVDALRCGLAPRVLVVGSDALCRMTLHGFRSLGAMTQTRCRPFDQGRDGMAIGEGAAFLLLEPGEGQGIEVLGAATGTDAHHLTAPDPEGRGLRRAIEAALGGVDPAGVDHVNAHATATPTNDEPEGRALAAALPNAAVSATKGATGHTLGAAGVVEAVFTLQSMLAGVVPPTVGLTSPLPGVDVAATLRRREQSVAVSVNLAFGGHAAAVAFRRRA